MCTNTTISTVWTKTVPLSVFPFAPFSTFTKTITIAIESILTGFSRGTRICYLSLWYDVYFSSIYLISTSCVQLPTHGSTNVPRLGRNIDNCAGMKPQESILNTITESNNARNRKIFDSFRNTLYLAYRGSLWHNTMKIESKT